MTFSEDRTKARQARIVELAKEATELQLESARLRTRADELDALAEEKRVLAMRYRRYGQRGADDGAPIKVEPTRLYARAWPAPKPTGGLS